MEGSFAQISSPALLQSVVDSSLNGVAVLEGIRDEAHRCVDFRVQLINQTAADLLGLTTQQLLGQTLSSLLPALFRSPVTERFFKVLETAQADRFEWQQAQQYRQRTAWFDISVVALNDSLVISFRDITEDKLRRQLLDTILDTSANGSGVCDAVRDKTGQIVDFCFVMVNGSLAEGYLASRLVPGQTLLQFLPRGVESPLWINCLTVCQTGEPIRVEQYSPEKDLWDDLIITRLPGRDSIVILFYDITARKRAELAVQRQREQLQFVTDSALTAISLYSIVRDPDTGGVVDLRYELINGMAERMTGRRSEELVGHTMLGLFPGIQTSGIWSRYQQLAETGLPLRYQNHYNYDGYDLWYEVQGVRKNDFIVLSFLDITKLKESQEANQRQAAEFKQILDNALTAISHTTAVRNEKGEVIDFVFQSFNRGSEQLTGKRAENVIGRGMLEVFPEIKTNGIFDRWTRLMEEGGQVRFQDQYLSKGLHFWQDTQAVKWQDGFIQSSLDITPIKRAELQQQQHAALLDSLLAAAPVGFIQCKAIRNEQGEPGDFRLELVNSAATGMTGLHVGETLSKVTRPLDQEFGRSEVFTRFTEVTQSGQPQQFELRIGERWFQVSVVPFEDGCVSALVDISQGLRYRQQLEFMNGELSRSNEALQEFAYVASHDLQEPLRKIQSFGDILLSHYGVELGSDGTDLINRMQSATSRMSVLIKDLLTFSRITTQREAFQRVLLNDILKEVLDTLDIAVRESGAVIDIEPLPELDGDSSQLKQLFQNLLSNALKFRKPDVAPYITVKSRQAVPADLPTELRDLGRSFYEISVIDNGIGFAPQYAERIFQVFQRLHTRQQYAGTGVGLSISKRVAENHGGTLVARSQPGQGATFLIYLPIPEEA